MIHVDVKDDKVTPTIAVETSVDGGPWKRQYTLEAAAYNNYEHAKDEAMFLARVFVNGARFAGAEVKSTAFGYNN